MYLASAGISSSSLLSSALKTLASFPFSFVNGFDNIGFCTGLAGGSDGGLLEVWEDKFAARNEFDWDIGPLRWASVVNFAREGAGCIMLRGGGGRPDRGGGGTPPRGGAGTPPGKGGGAPRRGGGGWGCLWVGLKCGGGAWCSLLISWDFFRGGLGDLPSVLLELLSRLFPLFLFASLFLSGFRLFSLLFWERLRRRLLDELEDFRLRGGGGLGDRDWRRRRRSSPPLLLLELEARRRRCELESLLALRLINTFLVFLHFYRRQAMNTDLLKKWVKPYFIKKDHIAHIFGELSL